MPRPLVILSLTALMALAGTARAGAAEPRPNVIFILADDLGWADLGSYGQERVRTPNIDRLAAEGMRFTDFYAGSTVCAPSRCVLMTGLHTGHCLIRGNGKDNLRPGDVTVAEVLRAAGYRTGLAGKWGLGHEGSTGLPTRQGFDSFFGYLDQTHAHNYYPHFLVRGEERVELANVVPNAGDFGQGVATEKVAYSHDLIADEALAFIDRQKEAPFFLYLALTIPHANNEAKDRGMEVPDHGAYAGEEWPEPEKGFAAMVSRMDRDVGRILERLERHAIDERTIVFFTSDNGPHSEGGHDPDFFDSNGPLRGIKRDLYEGGIRVPLLVRWPGKVKAGSVSKHAGAFQDVLPTLADLAGAREHVPGGLDGKSFAPTLLGNDAEQETHERLFWVFYERQGARAVRMGRWKAVEQPLGTPIRLYDLEADISESRDVAAEHAEIVERARKAMDEEYTASERWKLPGRKPRDRERAAGPPGAPGAPARP